MAFLKHIGKHGDRKVAIVFKTVPNEEHMCLVIYPEILQSAWHDTIMKVLETPAGQQAAETPRDESRGGDRQRARRAGDR